MSHALLLKNKTIPSDPYNDTFSSAGITPHFIPLLSHEFVDHQGLIRYLQSPDFLESDSFIITSQRAVEVLDSALQLIKTNQPKCLQEILQKIVYTVGPATSKVLKKLDFSDVRGGSDAGNGSILADLILQDYEYQISSSKTKISIVFFTGETRRDIIPRKLGSVGKQLRLFEKIVYKTTVLKGVQETIFNELDLISKVINKNSTIFVVFFSPQGANEALESINYLISKNQDITLRIASIGPTTQKWLLEHNVEPQVTAVKPQADALLEGIKNLSVN